MVKRVTESPPQEKEGRDVDGVTLSQVYFKCTSVVWSSAVMQMRPVREAVCYLIRGKRKKGLECSLVERHKA